MQDEGKGDEAVLKASSAGAAESSRMAVGITLGLPLGAAAGLVFGKLVLGAGIGLALGVVWGALARGRASP